MKHEIGSKVQEMQRIRFRVITSKLPVQDRQRAGCCPSRESEVSWNGMLLSQTAHHSYPPADWKSWSGGLTGSLALVPVEVI